MTDTDITETTETGLWIDCGGGVRFHADTNTWHGGEPNDEQRRYALLFVPVPDDVQAFADDCQAGAQALLEAAGPVLGGALTALQAVEVVHKIADAIDRLFKWTGVGGAVASALNAVDGVVEEIATIVAGACLAAEFDAMKVAFLGLAAVVDHEIPVDGIATLVQGSSMLEYIGTTILHELQSLGQ